MNTRIQATANSYSVEEAIRLMRSGNLNPGDKVHILPERRSFARDTKQSEQFQELVRRNRCRDE